MSLMECLQLVKTNGFYDLHLILSHFVDPYAAYLSNELELR